MKIKNSKSATSVSVLTWKYDQNEKEVPKYKKIKISS